VTERAGDAAAALARLDEITRRLRRECPWDREQDERSIVPHTVEEAYELADAAHSGDDAKLLDELGDVLFQVVFLSLLLEERGAGDLGAVAEHCRQKLIRRHPHVFGDAEVADAAAVLRNWDAIKRDERGDRDELFADMPENLPSTLYARKALRRAAAGGHGAEGPVESGAAADPAGAGRPLAEVGERAGRLARDELDPEARFDAIGELLFAAVEAARRLRVDPEIALRAAADRFRRRVEEADARP
jgi:MazG family protein